MPKAGIADDDLFPEATVEKTETKQKKGMQDDGSYVRSDGSVSPPREPKREPYPEPEDVQVEGKTLVVESPSGSVSFEVRRMGDTEWRRSAPGDGTRKRLELRWRVTEVYAGKPRPFYSWDELEQIKKAELNK
jgi:hypothetical protein